MRILILLIAWVVPVSGWAATYYAAKVSGTWRYANGAWPTSGSSACSANDIEGCLTSVGSNTLVLSGGASGAVYTRSDFDTDDNIYLTHNNQTLRGPVATDPDQANHGGEVVLDATGSSTFVIYTNAKSGGVISNLTIINSTGATGRGVSVDGTTIIEHCKFRNNLYHIRTGATGTTTTVRYNEFQGQSGTPSAEIFAFTGTGVVRVYNNVFRPHGPYQYGGGIQIQGTGTYDIANNVFSGTEFAAVSTFGTPAGGTVNVSNNYIISAGGNKTASGGVLSFSVAQTANVRNNIIAVSAVAPVSPIVNADIDTGNTYISGAYYSKANRRGYVGFSVDDYSSTYGSWAYIYGTNGNDGLAALFKARGMKFTWYIDVAPLKAAPDYASKIAWALSTGVIEIGLHTRSSSSMSLTNGSSVWTTSSPITINRTTDTITTPSGSITGFRSKTLQAIRAELAAAPHSLTVTNASNYNTYLSGSINETAMGEVLAGSSNSTTVALLVTDHTEGLYKAEIVDAKAELEAITGTTIKSMSWPYGESTAGARSAARASGLVSSRNVNIDTASSQHISDLNRYVIGCFNSNDVQANTTSGDASADIRANINGLMGYLTETGSIAVLLSHGPAELSLGEWAIVLDEVSKWQRHVPIGNSVGESLAEIMSYATDDGDGTLSYTWTDQADYRLRPGSPCIKAGTPISGLTTDFAGKNWKNPPSIGAYEYYGTRGGGRFGNFNFDFGW